MTMERPAINPWTWSAELGYHQGGVVSGQTRTLYCSGKRRWAATARPGMPVSWRRSWR